MTAKTSIDGWSLHRILGSGGFGIVELWAHANGTKLAIKRCKWDVTQLTETQRNRWINEVHIMKRLKHQNIIKGLELPFKYPDDKLELPVLCMEFCKKGDLRKVLNKAENCCGVSEKEAISVMKDISSAVEYLHANSITHRDLKPENIVLQYTQNTIEYKLIDLGYAKELGEASISASIVGTLNYVAPELLWKQKYSCSVDYWSLGILFYELVTGSRPFLPRMQHTMTWMQHIKNKGYDVIRASESEGTIIFGTDIAYPTNLSRCLRDKLAGWFRVVLQWDPKKRGKQCDENGVEQTVVFQLLHNILSKEIIHVFCVLTYQIYSYEVVPTTSIADLQAMIEKDTTIPVNQQTLTDYFGKIFIDNKQPLLPQVKDPVLFVFKHGSTLVDSIPTPNIPPKIQKMIELSRTQLDIETVKDYYKVATFFIKQEIYLFQLYIFAITIEVDLLMKRRNTFNQNITNTTENINTLLHKLSVIRTEQKKNLNEERMKALETNFVKVTKLVKATEQIKLKFDLFIEESNELQKTAQSIDCIKNLSHLYDKAVKILESCDNENPHKSAKPTDMVKLIFNFLQVLDTQFHNNNIPEILKQTTKLETDLLILERIFDSVLAMTTVYHEEIQNIIQFTFDYKSEMPNTNMCSSEPIEGIHMQAMKSLSNNTTANYDLINDSLVIRYTFDNLLLEIQKKYMKMIGSET
nr:PREDICTED: inhibitor of nuclear factor kappa-B kinase subunit alpha-like isoform X1 [Megachile rotundata]